MLCSLCKTKMVRKTKRRDGEVWVCEQCGTQRLVSRPAPLPEKQLPPDPRVAQPQ